MGRGFPCRWKWICLLCLFAGTLRAQEKKSFRIVFYNVENLFDARNDSLTSDDEFTPRGKRYWNRERYHQKILHVSRALLATGAGVLPAVIGMAEVENQEVLFDLTRKTGLVDGDYGIVHADSPDPRGIDVALLYQKSIFRVLRHHFAPVNLGEKEKTRDILYCEGVFMELDTVHFLVCHFPSMRGGEAQSEWKRIKAATVVKQKVDSIQAFCPRAMIVIMGDLNGRVNTPAQRILGTRDPGVRAIETRALYNVGWHLSRKQAGSYRYQGTWQILDHVIVSGTLLDARHALHASRMSVFEVDFLLEEERGSFGMKPRPTYRGPRYIGGYSDHLPVFIDLFKFANVEPV